MRFRVLGALEVFDGAAWVGIGAAKWRSLVAALVVRSPHALSMDQLVLELWGDHPPKTAATQIHGYVMRLRRVLGDRDGGLLRTVAAGYQLAAGVEDVDSRLFGAQVEQGHEALRAGQPERAAELLRQALALWRGPAMADVPATPLLSAEASRLGEQRLAAWEARVDADLACGRHAVVISELQGHVAEHPLRERSWGQLMVALFRSGRQAESLHAFQRLRRTMIDEIGAEPCAELQRLHQQLLCGDLPDEPRVVAHRAVPVCQLPADVPDFTGRDEQLRSLLAQLSDRTPDGPPPVVVVFGGPGIGKSTLAVHTAHLVAAQFEDGQLYLDLAGTSDEPRDPAVLLAELLRALGVTGAGIPDGVAARATLFRSLLARRRMLLVLDDAAHSEQVRPLLPPTGGCAVMITSRRLLTDLAGARHIELDVLREGEAHRLLAGIIGPDRAAREPEHATAILRACACLPLAIRIAAGKLVGRPAWPLRLLRERLDDESRRLNELRLGELGVRASFEASIDLLPPDAIRAFQLLGLLGPLTVPGWVLSPLLDRPDADDVLDALVDANLLRLTGIDVNGRPRYRLHDLLRTYAVEGAKGIPEPDRRAAVSRLLAALLDLATEAVDRLPPSLFRPPPGGAPRLRLPASTVDRLVAEPANWFEAERATLLGAVQLAVDWRLDGAAWELAATAVPYYDLRSIFDDWRRTHELALGSVRATGDLRGEAVLLRGLAQVHIYRDEYEAGEAAMRRALELSQRTGDKRSVGFATAGLATIDRVLGRHEQALGHVQQALDIVIAADDRHFEAQLRNALGVLLMALGRPDEARASFEEALAMCRRLGDVHREAVVLREVSLLYDRVGESDRAFASLRRALDVFETLDDERCVAYTLLVAGRVHAEHRDRPRAAAALERAAAIFAADGNRMEEAKCWQLLGTLDAELRDLPRARRHLASALRLWQTINATEQAADVEATLCRLSDPGS